MPEGGLMKKEFHQENRASLCQSLAPGSLLLLFSGHAPRKTGDEDYPYSVSYTHLDVYKRQK